MKMEQDSHGDLYSLDDLPGCHMVIAGPLLLWTRRNLDGSRDFALELKTRKARRELVVTLQAHRWPV